MTLLPGENAADFEKLRREVIAEYNPSGPSEKAIVEEMARLLWRKQNMSTYGMAVESRKIHSRIYAKLDPPFEDIPLLGRKKETRSQEELDALRRQADKDVQAELGTALGLVEIGDVATPEHLLHELAIIERLNDMLDCCLKRLLHVRGVKSLSPGSSARPPSHRIRRVA